MTMAGFLTVKQWGDTEIVQAREAIRDQFERKSLSKRESDGFLIKMTVLLADPELARISERNWHGRK